MTRTTKIITVIALAVGLVGGAAAIGKHRMGDPSRKADFLALYISSELELDSTQKQALDVLKDQLLAARQSMHADKNSMHEQVMSLMNADSFDKAKALQLVTAKTSAINALAPEIVTSLGDFIDTLNDAQKSEVTNLMTEHHGRHGRRH